MCNSWPLFNSYIIVSALFCDSEHPRAWWHIRRIQRPNRAKEVCDRLQEQTRVSSYFISYYFLLRTSRSVCKPSTIFQIHYSTMSQSILGTVWTHYFCAGPRVVVYSVPITMHETPFATACNCLRSLNNLSSGYSFIRTSTLLILVSVPQEHGTDSTDNGVEIALSG